MGNERLAGWDDIIFGIVKAFQLIFSGNPEVLEITFLSIRVSGLATILGSFIGIPLGATIALKKFPGKSLIISIINTLMGLPPVVVGLALYLLLSSSGPMGFLHILYTPEAMILAQLIMVVPIITGVTLSAVSSIDVKVRETAISLGANGLWETRIILNEARLGIVTSMVVGFGTAISEVGAIMIVGGNLLGYTRALTTAIVLQTSQGAFAEAIALGIILLILAFIVNLFLTLLQIHSKRGVYVSSFFGGISGTFKRR
jgi:tungstate transport system permease protein